MLTDFQNSFTVRNTKEIQKIKRHKSDTFSTKKTIKKLKINLRMHVGQTRAKCLNGLFWHEYTHRDVCATRVIDNALL